MNISEAKRLKALKAENSKLNRVVAEQALDIVVLRYCLKKVVTPQAKRACSNAIIKHGISEEEFVSLLWSVERQSVIKSEELTIMSSASRSAGLLLNLAIDIFISAYKEKGDQSQESAKSLSSFGLKSAQKKREKKGS